jgi:hypothetical protein
MRFALRSKLSKQIRSWTLSEEEMRSRETSGTSSDLSFGSYCVKDWDVLIKSNVRFHSIDRSENMDQIHRTVGYQCLTSLKDKSRSMSERQFSKFVILWIPILRWELGRGKMRSDSLPSLSILSFVTTSQSYSPDLRIIKASVIIPAHTATTIAGTRIFWKWISSLGHSLSPPSLASLRFHSSNPTRRFSPRNLLEGSLGSGHQTLPSFKKLNLLFVLRRRHRHSVSLLFIDGISSVFRWYLYSLSDWRSDRTLSNHQMAKMPSGKLLSIL